MEDLGIPSSLPTFHVDQLRSMMLDLASFVTKLVMLIPGRARIGSCLPQLRKTTLMRGVSDRSQAPRSRGIWKANLRGESVARARELGLVHLVA